MTKPAQNLSMNGTTESYCEPKSEPVVDYRDAAVIMAWLAVPCCEEKPGLAGRQTKLGHNQRHRRMATAFGLLSS